MKYKEIWCISDPHANYDKLVALLQEIGILDADECLNEHEIENKHVIFLGDYIDKGDQPWEVLGLVEFLVDVGFAHAIMGNHDFWLQRHLNGADVMLTDERKRTIALLEKADPDWRKFVKAFLDTLPFFYEIEGFKFAHAIYSKSAAEKGPAKQRFMLYGPVDREAPPREDNLPNRIPWYETYDGRYGKIIFGHYSLNTQISEYPHAVCVDCGVFKEGGQLGAYELFSQRKVHV